MVQSYQSPVRVYKYPFELIMTAYERRFPSCDMIPIMAKTDVVREETLENGAVSLVSRRCHLHAEVPYLLKKLMGVEFLFFIQTNTLHHRDRVLEIEAYNESFSTRVVINETCKYSVHPENPDWTCFEQTAKLDVKNFFGFESTVEKIAMKQYSQNISKGKEIINHFLDILKEEGITNVPRWVPPEGCEDVEEEPTDVGDENKPDDSTSEDEDFEDADEEAVDDRGISQLSLEDKRDGNSKEASEESESKKDSVVPTAAATKNSDKDSGRESCSSSSASGGIKKDRKDSTSAVGGAKKDRKKKESVSGDSGVKDKKEDGAEDKSKTGGAVRKVSLSKTESVSLEEDGRHKLDADYIAQCLGDLTPLQESRLVQLKKWVARLQKGKAPNDTTLLRFLRARDFHLEKSREMLSQSLLWRKRNQVDKIINDYQPSATLNQYFPGGWHFTDKDHRPLYLLRLGYMDVKGLVKSVGEEGLLRHTLAICEEGLRLTQQATKDHNTPITTWTLLVDLEGLNMRHLWRPGIKTLLTIIELVENNYPETMSKVLIIRAPRVFPILWTLVSTFIDDHTRSKFLFYGGNDYQDPGGLVDYISDEFIPDFLGGKCKSAVVEGGLVPKNLYLPGEEIDSTCGVKQHLQLSDHSIYRSVSLSRSQVHEVVLHIDEPTAVICWDFDVMKSDVTFSVIRTKSTISTSKSDLHSSSSSTAAVPANSSSGSSSSFSSNTSEDKGSVIDKSWKEGTDYFRVEPSLLCHDGESIQGSHVTRNVGTYVLQWRQQEATSSSHSSSKLDITAPHKAQLMYYFETLKSADYRGSMSSLQSCQSGFSALSSNTSKSLSSSCPSR